MIEDMEFCLEKMIKKTNSEEYIKILEQDKEDFAEKITRLNGVIDKIKEKIKEVNDDEFYINLTNKEKVLVDILELLEEIDV